MTSTFSLVFCFFIFNIFNLISPSVQYHKRWIRTNSWSEPTNWQPPRLPCPQDSVKLSTDVIFIENNVTMATGLNMNFNSEIVFGMNTNVVFGSGSNADAEKSSDFGDGSSIEKKRSSEVSRTCSGSGEQISFVGQRHKNWLNPSNWEVLDENGRRDDYLTKAVPYIERIPCTFDRVSFPQSGAFEIDISQSVSVKEMVVSGNLLSSQPELTTYMKSREGTTRFNLKPPLGSLVVNSEPCSTPPCPCGSSMWRESICTTFKCPATPTCKRRVKPKNDCCHRCGAVIYLSTDNNIDVKNCSEQLKSLISMHREYRSVRLYMYVTGNAIQRKDLEVLLSEDYDGLAADMAANTVEEYLTSTNLQKGCGGSRIAVKARTSASINKEENGSEEQVAAAVLLPLFIIGAIIILIVFIWYRRRNPKVPKVRFHNELDFRDFPGYQDIELNEDYTGREEGPFRSGNITFENPVFDIIEQNEHSKRSGETCFEAERESKGGVLTPVYTSPPHNTYETITEGLPTGRNIDEGYVELKLPHEVSGAVDSLSGKTSREATTEEPHSVQGVLDLDSTDVKEMVHENSSTRIGWVTDFDEGQDTNETEGASVSSDISINVKGGITSNSVPITEPTQSKMEWVKDFDIVDDDRDKEGKASNQVPVHDDILKYEVGKETNLNNNEGSRNDEKEEVVKKGWVTDFESS